MNTEMSLTGRLMGYMAPADDGTDGGGGGGGFNPTTIEQGVGIFKSPAEMRAIAEQQQANEEETGSLDTEANTTTVPTVDGEGEQSDGEDDKGADGADTGDTAGFQYNGVEVEVENKPEMVAAFEEKGINIDKVNKELFSKDGITAETKAVLDEAFGKGVVDMYLEGWANKNDAAIATAEANYTKANAEVDLVLTSIAGDKSDAVFAWANDNLSAEEYAEYADIMNGDNKTAMKFAFKELANRSGVLAPPTMATRTSVRKTALTPETTAPTDTAEGLSQAEYLKLFEPGEGGVSPYWGNEAKYDELRELGRQQGL